MAFAVDLYQVAAPQQDPGHAYTALYITYNIPYLDTLKSTLNGLENG
jgi:hypothetical protein